VGRTDSLLSLIRHEPHRKRQLQQFFVAAGPSLPSYVATIGGYTDRPTDTRLQQLLHVFVEAGTCTHADIHIDESDL
jgi:hypothetical protein